MARVVVLGGGYAGLASLITLAKRKPELDLHLIDAQAEHCKVTNLHKSFARPVEDFQVPYQALADRFGFNFHRQRIDFSTHQLRDWQQLKQIDLAGQPLTFDWLVIGTGAAPLVMVSGQSGFGLTSLRQGAGRALLDRLSERDPEQELQISLVGGGATGLQVLFELHEQLRKKRIKNRLRLIALNPQLVPELPAGAHSYVLRKLKREGIEYLPETGYLGHDQEQIQLEDCNSGEPYSRRSDLTLLFPGVARSPFKVTANAYGQVTCGGQELAAIFAVGDCSEYDATGLNQLTAQAAVRKGKLVSHNIISLLADRPMRGYRYQEKGYLVSLGAIDAIGWLGLRCNLASGFSANLIKEAMETQYDLFLDGIDTYLGFP